MIDFIKKLLGIKTVDYSALYKNGAKIIDVRTPAEFASGNIPGSENIPLDKISSQIKKIKDSGKPVITCCASGIRSGMAKTVLKGAGVDAYNGGGWYSLLKKISK